MFNAAVYNISVISWQSVLLVEESRVPGKNHSSDVNHWQNFINIVVVDTSQCHDLTSGTFFHKQSLLQKIYIGLGCGV